MIGFNYRMPAINAALGVAQLEQMDKFVTKKRDLALRYLKAFKDVEGVRIFKEPEYAQSNYWLNALVLDEGYEELRNKLLQVTNNAGIMTRPIWTLMSKLEMFKN